METIRKVRLKVDVGEQRAGDVLFLGEAVPEDGQRYLLCDPPAVRVYDERRPWSRAAWSSCAGRVVGFVRVFPTVTAG